MLLPQLLIWITCVNVNEASIKTYLTTLIRHSTTYLHHLLPLTYPHLPSPSYSHLLTPTTNLLSPTCSHHQPTSITYLPVHTSSSHLKHSYAQLHTPPASSIALFNLCLLYLNVYLFSLPTSCTSSHTPISPCHPTSPHPIPPHPTSPPHKHLTPPHPTSSNPISPHLLTNT